LTAPLRIAVIGGGIGGLAAAVSLLRVDSMSMSTRRHRN